MHCFVRAEPPLPTRMEVSAVVQQFLQEDCINYNPPAPEAVFSRLCRRGLPVQFWKGSSGTIDMLVKSPG